MLRVIDNGNKLLVLRQEWTAFSRVDNYTLRSPHSSLEVG